ncbi:MAG: hypothetical protein JSR72_03235 [Proteobacteria bacterium]|nr:hypothetical protein [Pseudomonadota bacterium]
MSDLGILAIWNNVAPGREADFETWFQGEHLQERLGVPGFIFGRRHQAISGASAFFNFYLVESPAVLTSQPYLERLDNPTPMTRTMMTEVFRDMNRTLCHRVVRRGDFRGAYAVTLRWFETAPDVAALTSRIETLVADPAIAAGEIWTATDPAGQPVSEEERLRGGDRKIKGALMIDTLREADAVELGAALQDEFAGAEVGVFRVLCQTGRSLGI